MPSSTAWPTSRISAACCASTMKPAKAVTSLKIGALSVQELDGVFLHLAHSLHQRGASRETARRHDLGLLLLQRVKLVKHARGFEPERGAGFTRCPNVHQAVDRVLFELQAQFVARRPGSDNRSAAEAIAVIADHRLDSA